MKLSLQTVVAAIALGATITVSAVPARKGNIVVTQPDGTTLTIHKIGDEFHHYTLTDDDMVLAEDENGQYSYGRVDSQGRVVSTYIKAYDKAVRPASHANFVYSIENVDFESIQKANTAAVSSDKRRTTAYNSYGQFSTKFPTKGKVKGLVILVEYSDTKFNTSYSNGVRQHFVDMLNEKGYSSYKGTGSAKDYFEDQSLGAFTPEFDVYGPYTLPNGYAYYGANNNNVEGDDQHPGEMIRDAVLLADDDVNYADYDFDNDGYVDNVYVFYAGKGEADYGVANTIWPHQYELSNCTRYEPGVTAVSKDGVIVDRYACSSEWAQNTPQGIGTFVHEFSHVLGLPDLYDTNYSHSNTPGEYSILDGGSYNNDGRTPPAYGAYERNALGWIDLDEFTGPGEYTLDNIVETNKAFVVGTSQEKEFFLFENRQQSGWDIGIPNHGLLIWHIDATNQSLFNNDMPNNSSSHQCVVIVKPNNIASNKSASGWTWPGTSKKTEFTTTTTPAFKDWNGVETDQIITDIAETDGQISFNVGMNIKTPVPDAASDIQKGTDYFIASWSPSKGATDYKLWVYAIEPETSSKAVRSRLAAQTISETADMGTSAIKITLPTDWTSSTTAVYTTSGNYGKAAPSAKLASSDAYIMTRNYGEQDVVSISFWCKGVSTTNASYVTVSGLIGSEWKELQKLVLSTNAQTITMSDIPEHVKQVKFVYTKVVGNLAIDDIIITTKEGKNYNILPDYDGVLTNANTQVRVDKLKDGVSTYCFLVAATGDGETFTDPSERVIVDLSQAAGVGDIVADEDSALNVSVNFRTISVNTKSERVDVYNTTGTHIISQRVSDGQATIDLPTSGMYIVRVDGASAKVVVR
jgi:M6 family metalloprotease-like protein